MTGPNVEHIHWGMLACMITEVTRKVNKLHAPIKTLALKHSIMYLLVRDCILVKRNLN